MQRVPRTIAALLLLLAAPAAAQQVSVEAETFELPNGLTVILHRDTTTPTIATNIWYHVGSSHEKPGRTGFAHLFEHIMFEGSKNVPEGKIDEWFAEVGGGPNGSTSPDRTNYMQSFSSNALDMALFIESDRMGWLLDAMSPASVDGQRDVVKNERRQSYDNRPYGLSSQVITEALYPSTHPYSWPVIGYMDHLSAAAYEDVVDFFRTYYAPNNAVLTLCGDFDPGRARDLIERYFGDIPRGPDVPPLPGRTVIPVPRPEPVTERVESEVALPRIYLAFRIPPYGDDRFYAADVAAHLLAGGKSSRLYRSLVREQRLAQSVVAYAFPIVTGAAMFVIWATANPDVDPEVLERALWREVEGLREEVPAGELSRTLTSIEARHVIGLQQVGERADQISMFATLFGDPGLINSELDRYRAVDADSVARVAASYLNREGAVTLHYLPRSGGGDS